MCVPNQCDDSDALAVNLSGIVIDVRRELREQYDISDRDDSDYRNYRGLCDEACEMITDKLKLMKDYGVTFTAKRIHGEQRHTLRLRSAYWALEHTWLMIEFTDSSLGRLYVDPTMTQFNHLYPEMPTIYLERKPPKWYLPDRKNPLFRLVPKRCRHSRCVWFKLIGLIEYNLLGRLNDCIRWMIGKPNERLPGR